MWSLLDDDSFDFRFEVGISDLSSKLHLSDRFHLLQSLSTHFTIVQVKAQIDSLGAIGVYDLMKCNPHIMKRLYRRLEGLFPGSYLVRTNCTTTAHVARIQ